MSGPSSIKAAYRRAMDRYGETVTLRRGSGASLVTAQVRARIAGFAPSELVGGINQGERKFVILAEDLTGTPFASGLTTSDRIITRSAPLQIMVVDDSTARVDGVQIALLGRAKGL